MYGNTNPIIHFDQENRLHVFYRASNTIFHKAQMGELKQDWDPWENISNEKEGELGLKITQAMGVVRNPNDLFEIFAEIKKEDGIHLMHKKQYLTAGNSKPLWTDWESIGDKVSGDYLHLVEFVVSGNKPGLAVFTLNSLGDLVYKYSINGTPWTDWFPTRHYTNVNNPIHLYHRGNGTIVLYTIDGSTRTILYSFIEPGYESEIDPTQLVEEYETQTSNDYIKYPLPLGVLGEGVGPHDFEVTFGEFLEPVIVAKSLNKELVWKSGVDGNFSDWMSLGGGFDIQKYFTATRRTLYNPHLNQGNDMQDLVMIFAINERGELCRKMQEYHRASSENIPLFPPSWDDWVPFYNTNAKFAKGIATVKINTIEMPRPGVTNVYCVNHVCFLVPYGTASSGLFNVFHTTLTTKWDNTADWYSETWSGMEILGGEELGPMDAP